MGQLTRSYDWSQTSLGPPDTWPQSLRTTLGILLNSKCPMALFWGEELICFYNDAYRLSFGKGGKQSLVPGRPGAAAWPETWPVMKPLIDQVLAGSEVTWNEDQLVPVYPNGAHDDVYGTFSFSPVSDESGNPTGVFVTCIATTVKDHTINQLKTSEQLLQNLVRDASIGIIVLRGEDMMVSIVNDSYARLIDRQCNELQDKPLFSIIPESEAVFRPIIDGVRLTGEPLYLYDQPYFVYVNGAKKDGFLNLVYQPYREQDGTITGVMVLCQDVTGQKKAEEALWASENMFRNVTNSAPTGLWLSDETGGLTYLNSTLVEWTGLPYDSLLGAGWASAIIDEDRQRSAEAFLSAVAARAHYDVMFRIRRSDGRISWCQAAGDPYYDTAGRYAGYAGFCMDVDELVKQRQIIEESEAKFRSLIEEAPVPTCVFVGRNLIIGLANQSMIDVWGKGRSVIGQPLPIALPELEGQPFLQIIDDVFTTGKVHSTKAGRADLVVNGVLGTYYFDYTFKALRNAAGDIYAIMEMAVDVTEEVLSRRKVEEAEAALRGAIEMAELGTFQINFLTGLLDYSERTRAWFGIEPDEVITSERAYQPLREADRARVREAIRQAISPDGPGMYNIEYTIDVANRERTLHIIGRTFFTEQGQAYKISGTVRDITEQRQVQQALEQQVQERTRQLQALVWELERSNDSLKQFAYIASHDLQEPLRKIQSFSDLLQNQYEQQLGEGASHVRRMQLAASRMSSLIKDLLAYTQLPTGQHTTDPVALTEIITNVLYDLELVIEETGAVVTVGPLPLLPGDGTQLNQLFTNLLSNALKFRQVGQPPVIQVSAQLVKAAELPSNVRPGRATSLYHRIDIADNGIGFEKKYVERIFQVFQRLHGKHEFMGTGIGLAICEKVAFNHGGAITATGQPGLGATFSVYLPQQVV